jgi:Fe-S cluster biogenesis protein NfuA
MAEPAGLSDQEVRARVSRLNDLLERLEQLSGPATAVAMEAIETLTGIYGAALGRVTAMADTGTLSRRSLAADEVVGHLLLLHGLHPDPPEERIARALAEVHGDVELTGIRDGVAAVRITSAGCQSTTAALVAAVTDAVLDAAPEITEVEPVMAKPPALIPVDALLRRPVGS